MMNPGHGRGPGSGGGLNSGRKPGDVVSDQFPAGLRVLLVDDDPTCLMILERMLRTCLYEVTKCNRAEMALSLLRKNRNGFDIVISDVHMPDMDGFKLLEHIGLEMDLPVIMMSADDSKTVVMKGVVHGACDYLIKPVRMEALKNIWQHLVRKRRNEWNNNVPEHSGSMEEVNDRPQQKAGGEDTDNNSSSANEGNWRNSRKRKDEEGEETGDEKEDSSTLKKPRVVWSVELHQQFVAAVNQLGVDKAVPKKILELMNVPGLTRENVASHLQKYRIYLRRLGGVSQHQGGLNNPFMSPQDASFGPLSSLNGFDLQALAVAGQLPAQSLAQLQAAGLARPTISKPGMSVSPLIDQRNIFSFDSNPKIRFGDGHPQQTMNVSNKQMNLLHGIPTGMEPKQLAGLSSGISLQQIAAARLSQNDQSNAMPMLVSQSQLRGGPPMHASSLGQPIIPNNGSGRIGMSDTISSRNSMHESSRALPAAYETAPVFNNFRLNQNPELPGNSFPLASAPGISVPASKVTGGPYQQEVNSSDVKGSSSGFTPSYDIFSELQQHNKPQDWDLRNIGLAFESRRDTSAAFCVSEGYSSSSMQRSRQNTNAATAEGKGVFLPGEVSEHSRGLQPNAGQQNPNQIYADSSVRVKSERNSEAGCPSPPLFTDQYSQEDLMSALLKQEGIAPAENDFDFDGYSIDNIPV